MAKEILCGFGVDVNDSGTPIGYGQKPAHWMVPVQRDTENDLTNPSPVRKTKEIRVNEYHCYCGR